MLPREPKPPYAPPLADVMQWRDAVRDVTPMHFDASQPLLENKSEENQLAAVNPPFNPPFSFSIPFTVDTRLRHYIAKDDTRTTHIEDNILRRIRLGRMEVERTLDLHGMTQEVAHHVLCSFLTQASRDACRLVLVITGKGSVTTHGVLRHALPRWCREATLAPLVIALHKAHSHHGGEGAYYIRVRKTGIA